MPLTPWVIALESGKRLAAPCDCAAGISETCSHVASLLWVIGVGVESMDSLMVTQDIDFIGKKRKSCKSGATISSSSSKKPVPEAPESEQMQFLNALAMCPGAKPALLAITCGYCAAYAASLALELPMVLSNLYQPDNLSLGYNELLQMAVNTDIFVTSIQAMAAGKNKNRSDYISAVVLLTIRKGDSFKFKCACHTDPAKPP